MTIALCFKCYQLVNRASLINSLHRPSQTQIAWQYLFGNLRVEHCANSSSIGVVNHTYHRTTVGLTCLINSGVEHSKERVLLLVLLQLFLLTYLSRIVLQPIHNVSDIAIGGNLLWRSCRGCLRRILCSSIELRILAIDLYKLRQDLCKVVGLPELEVSRPLEKFANTLRLLYARQLNQNTTGLGEFLDIRLYHAKAVNTSTKYFERIIHRTIHLFADYFLNILIGRVEIHLVFEFKSREHTCQLCIGVHLFERLDKECNKIGTAGFLFLLCQSHSLGESFGSVVAGEYTNNVRNADLHGNVHTAFQVKTEVNLFLAALFQGVAKPYFLCSNRVEINVLFCSIVSCILLCLLIVVRSNNRERQVEGAHQE